MIFGVDYGYVILYELFESNWNGLDVYLDKFDLSLNYIFMIKPDLSVVMS